MTPNPRDYPYDIEVYPNIFTYSGKHSVTGTRYKYEFSFRKNELKQLYDHLAYLHQTNARQIGFNNLAYDYIVIHYIIECIHYGGFDCLTPYMIYEKSKSIFDASKEEKHEMMIWDNNRFIEQIDLYKINHFDNKARATSLKMLEFNMRSKNIEDLPFPPGTFLNSDQCDELITYNDFDVDETEDFLMFNYEAIEFREQLTEEKGKSFINYSDKKIGEQILVLALEEANPGCCYEKVNGRRQTRQTFRNHINLNEVILPYIKFQHPEFQRIRDWLASQVITETKGVFKGLHCIVDGFKYDFGTGGIHGSVKPCIVQENDEYALIDIDAASFYPNIGIVNRFYPRHLSELFCDIYEGVYKMRKQYKKGTPLNTGLKLALNGAYGDSNSVYSPFYDPQYTMSITINGQLMLCMLAEQLRVIPNLKMIQINTDGMTVYCPRKHIDTLKNICGFWETITGLTLEDVYYSRMFIRDVNNYIGEYTDGKLKRKGAYCHETNLDKAGTGEIPWHKNHSSLAIQKAAQEALVNNVDIREAITNNKDIYDFMRVAKVPRSMRLLLRQNGKDTELQKITRYQVSHNGGELKKIMPPVNKKAYVYIDQFNNEYFAFNKQDCKPLEKSGYTFMGQSKRMTGERTNSIESGWFVTPCNNMDYASFSNLNYEFYIQEVEKLVNPIKEGKFL